MSFALTKGLGWNNGFRIVFYIQIALTIILLVAIPLWKKARKGRGFKPISQFDDLEYKISASSLPQNADIRNQAQSTAFEHQSDQNVQNVPEGKKNFFSVFKIKGVWFVLIAFFAYSALEQTIVKRIGILFTNSITKSIPTLMMRLRWSRNGLTRKKKQTMKRAIKVILAIILTILTVSAIATGIYLVAEWVSSSGYL